MLFGSLIMLVAVTISAIAAWYSVAGLTAIFSAAVIPVIIMGGALEAGKIVATVWLHNNWHRISWTFKTYLVPAVVFLMILTSLGIFGFLSKAHSDQSVVTGDTTSQVAIYDEKIATERENIAQAKQALEQMNAQVDQMLGRSNTERGAERAVSIRKNQARERAALQTEITKSQKTIQQLQAERAPLAAEARKIEAEVGPIRYIAALIYGNNTDQNLLEAAVRWVIILIVIVFDPLALTLILAANRQFEWAKQERINQIRIEKEKTVPTTAVAVGQPTEPPPCHESAELQVEQPDTFFAQAKFTAHAIDLMDEKQRAEEANAAVTELTEPTKIVDPDQDHGECPKCNTKLLNAPGIAIFCPNKECDVFDAPDLYKKENLDIPILENEETWAQRVIDENQSAARYEADDGALTNEQIASIQQSAEEEKSVQVAQNIEDTPPPLAEESTTVDEFNTPIRRGNDYAVRYKGKVYNLDAFNKLYPNMAISADNDRLEEASQCGFGERFPDSPMKGDMFIRTDYLPDRLFKWNGQKWIEVDKNTTDSYTYNQAYIQHLVQKLEAGEYEIEDLSEAEQAQVEQQIEEILKSKHGQ